MVLFSYAYKLFLALQGAWIAAASMFMGTVQVGFGGVDGAQIKSLADLFDGECRLFPRRAAMASFAGSFLKSWLVLFLRILLMHFE